MKSFLLLFLFTNSLLPVFSQSNLLESAKNNPSEAKKICNKFRELNLKGKSASSNEAIEYVSKKSNLNPFNAEIFSIYVIGLYCPEII
tara:strand:+ start:223 stop:486 length:264 start_codon:yes stop_codon:yes gene_type:complete